MDTSTEIIIEPKASSFKMASISIIFGLCGLWFVLSPSTFESQAPPFLTVTIGLFCILLSIQGLYTTILNHTSEGFAIRMNPTGLSVRVGGGLFDIPWSDITGTFIIGSSSNRFIGIRLVDTKKHLAQQTLMFKILQLVPPYHGTPVWIPEKSIPQELEKVREAIETYRHLYANEAS